MEAITLNSLFRNTTKGLLIFLILPMNLVLGQVPIEDVAQGETVTIQMENGEEFNGELINKDENELSLKTQNGQVNLLVAKVKKIKKVDYDFSKFRFENPNKTRYFFAPSAVPLGKGEGYYQNVLLTANSINYGITKNISIGGGIEFISTVLGEPIWFLNPKVGFPIAKNLHIGGGVLLAGIGGSGGLGLTYGVVTYGTSDTNISIGLGRNFKGGGGTPIVISGTARLSNNISLLTENYILPLGFEGDRSRGTFGIHGIRILAKKNTFDIGAMVIPELINFIPALPYVGFTRHF